MTDQAAASPMCTVCTDAIEGCAFCDQPRCPIPTCFRCVSEALRESVPQPHGHGG